MPIPSKYQVYRFVNSYNYSREEFDANGKFQGTVLDLKGAAQVCGFRIDDLPNVIVIQGGYVWLLPYGTLTKKEDILTLKEPEYASIITSIPKNQHVRTSHGYGILQHGTRYRVIQTVDQSKNINDGFNLFLHLEQDINVWVDKDDFEYHKQGYQLTYTGNDRAEHFIMTYSKKELMETLEGLIDASVEKFRVSMA